MYVKTKVTSKYQITLPKNIRKKLKIEKGDDLVFEGKGDKIQIKVEKSTDPVETIEGILEGQNLDELKTTAASKMFKKKLGIE